MTIPFGGRLGFFGNRQCEAAVHLILIGAIPMCFHLSILRVISVKMQLIYCQLKWRHVSTHRVIIRPIIKSCLRYNNGSIIGLMMTL